MVFVPDCRCNENSYFCDFELELRVFASFSRARFLANLRVSMTGGGSGKQHSKKEGKLLENGRRGKVSQPFTSRKNTLEIA